jgi:hypothetical protein
MSHANAPLTPTGRVYAWLAASSTTAGRCGGLRTGTHGTIRVGPREVLVEEGLERGKGVIATAGEVAVDPRERRCGSGDDPLDVGWGGQRDAADRRQPSPDRAQRHPHRRLRRRHDQRVRKDRRPGPLGRNEPQHIGRLDLTHRLGHHSEENRQVKTRRQHRVRSAPHGQELEIRIQQRITQPLRCARVSRRNQAQHNTRHRGASSRTTDTPNVGAPVITKITHISSMRGRLDLGFGLYGGRQFVHLPESPAPSPQGRGSG